MDTNKNRNRDKGNKTKRREKRDVNDCMSGSYN
jgi:hypothetical protein